MLIAASQERGALLWTPRLRVALGPIPRQQMEAEKRAASAPSASTPLLADAARVSSFPTRMTEVWVRCFFAGRRE